MMMMMMTNKIIDVYRVGNRALNIAPVIATTVAPPAAAIADNTSINNNYQDNTNSNNNYQVCTNSNNHNRLNTVSKTSSNETSMSPTANYLCRAVKAATVAASPKQHRPELPLSIPSAVYRRRVGTTGVLQSRDHSMRSQRTITTDYVVIVMQLQTIPASASVAAAAVHLLGCCSLLCRPRRKHHRRDSSRMKVVVVLVIVRIMIRSVIG